jgi:Tfp pilus assembly protein PilF
VIDTCGAVVGASDCPPPRLFLAFALAALVAMPAIAAAPRAAATAPSANAAAASAAPALPAVAPAAALLAVIDAAIAEGRLKSANDLITRTRPGSDGPQLQLRRAELILAGNDLAGAVTAFTALATEAEVAARALQGLGIARLRQSNLAAAATALDAALTQDAGLARGWNARGVVADRQRDWTKADAAYAHAIAIDPRSAAALSNRGYSLLLRGRHVEAEADFARAIALDPGLATAATNLRFARALQGHYTQAFAGSTREGLATDLNTVGFAALARGDYGTAETYFSRALAFNKQFDRTAWNNLEFLKQHRRTDAELAAASASASDAARAAISAAN